MAIEIKSSRKPTGIYFKCAIFGRPGKGKTMITPTCPKPVLLLTEQGGADSLTERNIISVFGPPETAAQIKAKLIKEGCPKEEAEGLAQASVITYDIPRVEAFTPAALTEALDWLESPAADAYETVVMDSLTEASKLALSSHEAKTKHGMKAYGAQAKDITKIMRRFLAIKKHVVCLMQAGELRETRGSGDDAIQIIYTVPALEGRQLKLDFPHMFGEVYQAQTRLNDAGKLEYYLQTRADDPKSYEKSRRGVLQDQEVPHIGQIIHTIRTHG